MIIKNLVETETMCDKKLLLNGDAVNERINGFVNGSKKLLNGNNNGVNFNDKLDQNNNHNRSNGKQLSHDTKIPDIDDKTSDSYIPKSYRSQSATSRFLTTLLAFCGLTFLQPIKWKNVISIMLLHLLALHSFLFFPIWEARLVTILWGKFVATYTHTMPPSSKMCLNELDGSRQRKICTN